jgi:hypothetical protein
MAALLVPASTSGCGGGGSDDAKGITFSGNCDDASAAVEVHDTLSPTRILRRIFLSLTGRAPIASDYEPLLAASDDAAREALLDKAIDDALASPGFYETMHDFGRVWLGLPPIPAVADEPDYMASQQHNIPQCPEGTLHAGAYVLAQYITGYPDIFFPCDGKEADGTDALVKQIEPWWAPGTTVEVLSSAALETATVMVDGEPYDCGGEDPKGEGLRRSCGPNMIYCHPSPTAGFANWPIYLPGNPQGQRRLLWDESARLIAHVAWYDRPLTDIVLGDYSVGPVEVQVAYVRAGRRTGASSLDEDDSWWRPQKFTGDVDPLHDAGDPWAWREFQVAKRNPYLLTERDYKFDPRVEPRGSMRGIPSAGVLTTIGMLNAYPRERIRAARMLEAFACESFIPPPADQTFNPYKTDPAREGPCQVCHSRIDPAAIHFKRSSKSGFTIHGGGAYLLVGVGNWQFDDSWTTKAYPYNSDPFIHWVQWWKPESAMTPVSVQDADANAEARFIDYLPTDQTLLGQTSDGTVGPLGFAKMIVASGAFDRCAVARLHERFGGRAIDVATESGYIDALVEKFVAGGRRVRPFLKELTKSEVFRRGL